MIQAASLSDIHGIADEPPGKPSFKRVGGSSQLILYIERVPGSPDIFLTTLKPRDKTVTAHDVESSLYYCHLESEQDDLLNITSEEPEDENGDEEPAHLEGPMTASAAAPPAPPPPPYPHRPKSLLHSSSGGDFDHPPPVPEHAVLPSTSSDLAPPPPLPRRPSTPEPSPVVKRKPVGSAAPTTAAVAPGPQQHDHHQNGPALPLRPAGPRPLVENSAPYPTDREQQHYGHSDPLSTQLYHGYPGDNITTATGGPPSTPPRWPASTHASDSFGPNGSYAAYAPSPPRSRDGQVDPRPRTSPITRAPSSWDGSMSRSLQNDRMPPPQPISPRSTSSTMTRTSSVGSAAVSVGSAQEAASRSFNIIVIRRDPATGMQKNVGKITMPPVSTRAGRSGKALLQLFTPGYEKFRSARATSTADLVRCLSEDDTCTYSCDLRLATRRRSLKNPSAPYFGDVPVNQLIAVTPSQPYSFLSPWNRVCEFSTGVSGRSLKCRHMLARGTLTDANPNDMNVISLSELRFNTPSSSVFAKVGSPKRPPRHLHSASASSSSLSSSTSSLPPSSRMPLRKLSMQRLSQDGFPSSRSTHEPNREVSASTPPGSVFDAGGGLLHRNGGTPMPPLASSSLSDDRGWDMEPMDLTLGQERAGGGFRGNKAKLGKLVIEPEGMEMLDLLVAANMGVWWSIT